MASTRRKRLNLQWERTVPGRQSVAANTLSSFNLVTPSDINSASDDYTFVRGFFHCRVSASYTITGLHSVLGAVGIIKRPITADSAQYDPINEDAQWMWWRPLILSSVSGSDDDSSWIDWQFEIKAGRRIERYDAITAYLKTVAGSDTVTWSCAGSLLFYKP